MKRGVWLLRTVAVTRDGFGLAGAVVQDGEVPRGYASASQPGIRQGRSRTAAAPTYVPEKADGPLPVIVWVHGGAWLPEARRGAVRPCPSSAGLRRGQHQLSPQPAARFPAQIEDCKAAIRWLRANARTYNLDAGHSASGGVGGRSSFALLGTSGDVKDLEGKRAAGPVEPGAGGRGLVRPDRCHEDGRRA